MDSLYKHLFLLAPTGIAVTTVEGHWIQVNPALCRLLNCEEQALLAMPLHSMVHSDDIGVVKHFLRQLTEGDIHTEPSIDVRYVRQSGEIIWVSLCGSRLLDEAGSLCLTLHFIDMTSWKQAEQNYVQSNHLQKLILEHASDIISYSSPEGYFEYVSPSIRCMLGYEPEEMIGRHHFDVIHPEDVKLLHTHQFTDHDKLLCRTLHKDGHYVWFETTMKLIRNEQGELKSVVGMGRDVTERTLTEQALIQSERNLAEAQQIANIGSWEWDAHTDTYVWSEQFLRILDLSPLETSNRKALLPQYIHPDDRHLLQMENQRALQTGSGALECRIISARGVEKNIFIQGIVRFTEDGKPVTMHGTMQDITDYKKVVQQLEESVDRYNSLKKYSSDAIISVDLEGYITSANPVSEKISGYKPNELVGKHFTELVHPVDLENAINRFSLLMEGRANSSCEVKIYHKEGMLLDLVLTPAPIIIRQKLVGCYILVKDVTVQKKKDEFLRNSEKLSVVGQLAAGVAHEIRNPLTALKGFIKLMMNSGQQQPKYLAIMQEELERIELIVSELLMLSKPQPTQLRPVQLQELVEEVTTLISTQAIMKNIAIEFVCEADRALTYCDPNQIKQVIINFLKNAIEAMTHEGQIGVELFEDAVVEQTILRITDQGCGIPAEQLSRLGEPFFTTKEGGTGLGLMVSRGIIEHHGGKLTISSELNVGTTVEVRLPLFKESLIGQTAVGI